MTNFDLTGFGPPQPDPPPPPIDAAAAQQQRVIDDTKVAGAITRFITDKQDVLFNQPDAFYRTEGADAIHAAPVTARRLLDLKDAALDGTDNDYQRRKLGAALEAHMVLARDGIAHHVADQSLAWQRQTALDRIDVLAKEAALHHTYDDDTIGMMGEAAANAARAHVRVGDAEPAPGTEDRAAASARSRVLSATIQARLDAGNLDSATRLYDMTRTQLDESQVKSLGDQLETARRWDGARAYSFQVLPGPPPTTHEEADGQHADATAQNQRDHADDPPQQAAVQHWLDVDHAQAKQGIDDRQAALDKTVADWIATPRADGTPQTDLPSPAIWNQLDDKRRAALLEGVRRNQRSAEPGAAGTRTIGATAIPAPSWALGGGRAAILRPLMNAASRLAPVAAEASLTAVGAAATPLAAAGAAAGTLLIPTNSESNTIDLGNGLRARWAPDSRTATIERRVDNGLLGTGLGAKWEELPVPATYDSGPDGRRVLKYAPDALAQALTKGTADLAGADSGAPGAFHALPLAKPIAIKVSIAKEIDGVITFENATDEETEKYCGSYPRLLEIGNEATEIARTMGRSSGNVFGTLVHGLADNEIRALLMEGLLKRDGVRVLHPEIALKEGEPMSMWRAKGTSFPDVTEIYDREKACVYDFKTGTGKATRSDMRRYIREVKAYADKYYDGGYTHIYFITVQLR